MNPQAFFTLLTASLIGGAFLVPAAVAQVSGGPTPDGCSTNVVTALFARAEGLTERVNDITLLCVGGTPTALGAPVPTVSLRVILNAPITSRLYPNGWSEVELIVDEPNSGLITSSNTQLACADPNGFCTITGTGTGVGTYDGTAGRPNVFLGRVSGNMVTFPSIPFDPPGSSHARVFRIVNLRVNATTFPLEPQGVPSLPVEASIFFSPTLALPITNSTLNVAYVFTSASFSLRSPDDSSVANSSGFAVSQCHAAQRAGVFRVAQGSALKPRTFTAFVDSETSPAPAAQKVPGAINNSESGFYNPAMTAPTVNFATVGLADAGTRVRAVIDNIPNGTAVFVSTQNVDFSGGNPSVATTNGVMRLVQNETTAFVPVPATATLEGVAIAQLPVLNGTANAVWEFLGDGTVSSPNYDFAIWVGSGAIPGSATITGSFAPAPPAFAAAGAGAASATLPVPRFISTAAAVPLFNNNACAVAAPTSTVLTVVPAGTPYQYSLTATVTTPNPALTGLPAGTVAFYDNGTLIAGSTTPSTSGGAANIIAALVPAGHRLTAVFTPFAARLFTASTSPEVSLSVAPSNTSTALIATPAGAANQYSLTATVTAPNPALTGPPAGTVTLYDNGALIASAITLTSAGTANCVANLPIGAHRLTAVFTPANTQLFTSSTSPDLSLSVNPHSATSIEITSNSNPSLPGQPVTFIATVTGSAPTGTVQFTDGLRPLGSVTLLGSRASLTSTLTTVGVHDIFATYSGDGSNTDASGRFGQTVSRVTDSLALTTSSTSAVFGQAVTLTATLTLQAPAGVPAATGTVQFQEGPTVIGTAALAGRTATLVVSNLTTGTHQIVAVYSGDANWYGLHSSALTVSVIRGATNTILTSSATITEVRLAATLTPAPSAGSVQFLDTTSNSALGTVQPVNGIASLALTPADAAQVAGHAVAAVYSGSAGLAGSTSSTLVLPALRNAAGGTRPEFAPEELVSLFGTRLVETTQPEVATAMPLSLGGLSVNIADATGAVFPAGLSYVSPSQVNFLIPSILPRGAALVTVMHAGAVVAALPVTVARVAGIFGASQIVRADSGAVVLVLYGTGLRNRSDNTAVTCMVNEKALPVVYAGAQPDFAGLDQVNVPLPSDLRTAATLSVSLMVDGQSSNVITVAMQ